MAIGFRQFVTGLLDWWKAYNVAEPNMLTLVQVASQFSTMTVREETLEEGKARWERGEPDYLGRDAFDNIQAYIDAKLQSGK